MILMTFFPRISILFFLDLSRIVCLCVFKGRKVGERFWSWRVSKCGFIPHGPRELADAWKSLSTCLILINLDTRSEMLSDILSRTLSHPKGFCRGKSKAPWLPSLSSPEQEGQKVTWIQGERRKGIYPLWPNQEWRIGGIGSISLLKPLFFLANPWRRRRGPWSTLKLRLLRCARLLTLDNS